MSIRRERKLLSIRRRIPRERIEAYRTLWKELSAMAEESGANAWRFVSPADPEEHLEFLEFEGGADLRARDETRALMTRMDDEAGPSEIEEWTEDA